MTKHKEYQIDFLKNTTSTGEIYPIVRALNKEHNDIANHLNYSDSDNTSGQISGIERAISRFSSGLKVNNFWGEVFGSALYVYPDRGTVEIGRGMKIL